MIRIFHRGLCLALLALVTNACNGAPRHASSETGTLKSSAESGEVQRLNLPANYWKDVVSPEAFRILFEHGTERPGSSPLNDEHRDGVFVCAACRLPLFSSKAKFESGTGWPSFFEPIAGRVGFAEDHKLVVPRTEYHCIRCGGHQGHVFDDGPKPTGQRWCNNGLALKFVPAGEALPPLRGGGEGAGATAGVDDAEGRTAGVDDAEGRTAGVDDAEGRTAGVGDAEGRTAGAATTAIFAGGCFWCMETAFEGVEGVATVVSGYTGGHTKNPTYDTINTHTTGHVEAVKVTFDPAKISYDQLLDIFWHNVDPTDAGGQFCDRGNTYASAIFFVDDTQKALAEASLARVKSRLKVDRPIVTPIREAATFYDAEEYHQDYFRKKPLEYKAYRFGCGRDAKLKALWGMAPELH